LRALPSARRGRGRRARRGAGIASGRRTAQTGRVRVRVRVRAGIASDKRTAQAGREDRVRVRVRVLQVVDVLRGKNERGERGER
jgi:hypothetical protein